LLNTLASANLAHSYTPYLSASHSFAVPRHPLSIEDALVELLQAYTATPEEQRPHKIRSIKEGLSPANQVALQELGGLFSLNSQNSLPNSEKIESANSNACFQPTSQPPQHSTVEGNCDEKAIKTEGVVSDDKAQQSMDFNFLDFFSTKSIDPHSGSLQEKDLDLWSSTVQDFLVFDDI